MMELVKGLFGIGTDAAGSVAGAVSDYQQLKLMLGGLSGGFALVFVSIYAAVKLQQADQSEESRFTWKSVTGIMAALVDLIACLLGAAIIILALYKGYKL